MIKRNLIANYVGQGWGALMGIAFIPLYVKSLGVESYGLIGVFGLLQACLGLLDMGLTPTLSREIARYSGGAYSKIYILNLFKTIEIMAAAMSAFIILLSILTSNWMATVWLKVGSLSPEVVSQAFVVMGSIIALRFIEGIYRSVIIGMQRQVLLNVINAIMSTIRWGGAAAVLVFVNPTITAFFLWQFFVSIAFVIFLRFIVIASMSTREFGGGKFSIHSLRNLKGFLGGMIGINFLTLLLTQVDKVILSKILTLSEFGFYTLAATLAGALYMLISPITQTFYPKFCELYVQSKSEELVDCFHSSAQLVSVIAGSAATVLIVFSETFLLIWTRDAELSKTVSPLLSVLMFGNLLNGLMWVPYQMQLASGWTSLTAKINIASVCVIVPAIMWVVPKYGPLGAAWVWVALNLGYCIIDIHLMHKKVMISEKINWYMYDVLIPIGVAFLTALFFKSIFLFTQELYLNFIQLLIVSIFTFIVAAYSTKITRKYFNSWSKFIFNKLFSNN